MPAALSEFSFFLGQLARVFAQLCALAFLIACVTGLCWLGAVLIGVQ